MDNTNNLSERFQTAYDWWFVVLVLLFLYICSIYSVFIEVMPIRALELFLLKPIFDSCMEKWHYSNGLLSELPHLFYLYPFVNCSWLTTVNLQFLITLREVVQRVRSRDVGGLFISPFCEITFLWKFALKKG